MIGAQEIDDWVEFVLAGMLAQDGTVETVSRAMVDGMAARHPDAPALTAVLPLSMAAAAIEGMLAEPQMQGLAERTWRVAALMATEVLALQAQSQVQSAAGLPPDLAALKARLRNDPGALGGGAPA